MATMDGTGRTWLDVLSGDLGACDYPGLVEQFEQAGREGMQSGWSRYFKDLDLMLWLRDTFLSPPEARRVHRMVRALETFWKRSGLPMEMLVHAQLAMLASGDPDFWDFVMGSEKHSVSVAQRNMQRLTHRQDWYRWTSCR
jgi:hypothetical protein